ncbi:hypothetical protein D6T63_01000 [Arthrobacter cheniae]|uniref:Uncharacterized protein n=1 Tax=Arthrobacter cheniae TaxID=1258888 RepID=A0A3A5MF20_9MICC|nr:hypothetical protein D6T63_01000 [Arthrobacter cheniae]
MVSSHGPPAPQASEGVVVPTLHEAMKQPWALRRTSSCAGQVVIVDGSPIEHNVEVAKASNPRTFPTGWRVLRTVAGECRTWEASAAGPRPEVLRRVNHTDSSVRLPRTPTKPQSVLVVPREVGHVHAQ